MKDKKYIVSFNFGGIGNRIKGLWTILMLADKLKRIPLLYWPENVKIEFSELFETNIKQINKKEFQKIKNAKDSVIYKDWLDNLVTNKKYLLINNWRILLAPGMIRKKFAKTMPTLKGNNIDFEFQRIPKHIREEVLKYLKQIKPTKEIVEMVESFSRKNKIENMVGVHIRRRDFKNSPDGRGKISTEERFVEKMKEILEKTPKTKFFLATDSEKTEKRLKAIFKTKIISYPKPKSKVSEEFCSNPNKYSLVDILLLSRTKYLLGTYFSTFTEIVWWFGGAKAKIDIIGDEEVEKKKKVIKSNAPKNKIIKKIILFLYNVFN